MRLEALLPWQTSISALLGFTGVICAMLYNAKSARTLAKSVRSQEAISLCVALQQELISYRDYVQSLLESIHPLPSKEGVSVGIHPIITRQVFDANIGKVGLLRPVQVAAVLTAYHLQGEFLRRLKILGTLRAGSDSNDVTITGGNFQPLMALLNLHASAADAAVKSLGPPPSWHSPINKETGGVGLMDPEAAASLGLVADPITGVLSFKNRPQDQAHMPPLGPE